MDCVNKSIEECPILIFLLFQKAIRSELDRLNSEAIAFATGGRGDLKSISKRFRFLLDIYKHHCDAEDEVIFPALDIHVKNVAWTYSLEHKGERALISQLFELLNSGVQNDNKFRRDLASCAGAIHTSIIQHICKEEKQIYPLLIEKFTFEEQVDLVWHFICSIPVNMMEEFLPWLSSCISPYEHHDIVKCMCKIAPEQNLLPQVISSWMEGRSTEYRSCSNDGSDFQDCLSSGPEKNIVDQTEKKIWACHHSKTGKRKHLESNCDAVGLSEMHPINGILHWHNAIKRELNDILEVARKMQDCSEVSDLSTFHSRLQFIGDICNFHSIAEDQVIVPAVDREISFVQEHSEEESQFTNFKNLIKKIWCTEAPVSSTEIHSALILHADQLKESIQRHFQNEEAEVLPLVRFRLCPEKQRELLYKSIWVMPLKLLERAIPWFVATLTEEEAKSFLQNIQMAASTSDAALITLLCSWACKGQPQETSSADIFICLPSNVINRCPLEEKNGTLDESSYLQTKKYNRPFEKCTLSKSYADDNNSESTNITNLHKLSYDKQSCLYSPKSSHSISDNSSALSLKSSLILKETKIISLNGENTVRPIDSIFIFHKAILKDLEYLDVESGKFLGSDEVSLRQFSGRFCLLWGLYKAHSNSEDDIIFPALESKAALHNVSHSYILDHKQEENLFTDISTVLEENSQLQATNLNELQCDWEMKHNELATKLQALCKSLRITLEQHIFKEELELWPLFNKHFSVEEQNKIMGRIIGRTGAEVLQSMLPWVTSALSLEEKKCMMDTWKQATKNTMFNEWLNEWWNGTTTSFSHAITHTNLVDNTATGDQDDHNQNDQMFKAGWKYIFRMNQIELESELQKASFNSTLDPRREAYLIQNLLTSRWIAAQQKSPLELTKEQEDSRETPGCSSSFRDRDKKIFGCEHYKRNCKLLATCCNKMFTCRFCHDKASDHSMDRKATTQMLCMRCLKVQPVGQTCRTPSCDGLSMAKYFCHICKLFDDERAIYHCPFCNLCRIGKGLGIDFFHCMGCNFCMGMKLLDHKCPGKTLERNCPICCDYLFTTTERFRALRCGHLMHTTCFQAYTCSHYTCPICSKSLGDMTVYFGMLDALLAAEELPEEYRDRYQDIICNDCDKKGKSRFHWLYHKCGFCGSYNTMVIKNEASEGIMFFLV